MTVDASSLYGVGVSLTPPNFEDHWSEEELGNQYVAIPEPSSE